MIFLALVIPVGIYCLVLCFLNRKRHPVVVSGPWDFAGVLFAASGILLVGGPAMLTGIYEQWRLSWLLGETRYLQGVGENWSFWISLWLLYFAVVTVGSAFMLRRRRELTSIYHVEPAVLAEVLIQVLDRLGLEWQRNGPRHLLIRFRESPLEAGGEVSASVLVSRPSQLSAGRGLVEPVPSHALGTALTAEQNSASASPWIGLALEPFPMLYHVTLRWSGSDEMVRCEVEAELARTLAQVRTRRNLVSAWFLWLALGLFSSAFLVASALFVSRILQLLR